MTESAVVPIRPSDLSGDQIPDELRTKIGELVSRWAYIEYQLKVVIRVSLGITRAVQNLLLHRRTFEIFVSWSVKSQRRMIFGCPMRR